MIVKTQNTGYLVNGNKSVPNDPRNKDYQAVQRWLLGKTDEWLALEAAHKAETAAHDNWQAIQSYEDDLAAYEVAKAEYDAWEWSEDTPVKPEMPTLPIKPKSYHTQEAVDASQLAWDAWNVHYQTWLSLEDPMKGDTYHVTEPVILQRPAHLPEPIVLALPDPIPNTPEPEFTAEELEQQAYARWKGEREQAVSSITVTTQAGNTFDGDEVSQTRMARAITVISSDAATELPWVLADNTVVVVGVSELIEALALSGAAQSALWVRS